MKCLNKTKKCSNLHEIKKGNSRIIPINHGANHGFIKRQQEEKQILKQKYYVRSKGVCLLIHKFTHKHTKQATQNIFDKSIF